MKRKWLGVALSAVLACGATAWADILASDNAGNYPGGAPIVDGTSGGFGFGNWECSEPVVLESSDIGGICGDINSEENDLSFRIARDDANDYGHVYRSFDKLIPGNALSLKFTCAWDGGGRGIDLYAGGDKIANAVNLGPGNQLTVNGSIVSEDFAKNAVYGLTLVQGTDGIELTLTRTADGLAYLEYNTTISANKVLDRIGFYAGGWDWNGGADVDNYALFVNDLQIEGELPQNELSLSGPWAVTEATADLEFTVSRTGTEGDLEVALSSSWEDFVSVPESVTIRDGERSATFQVQAALQGGGNEATITASAEGMDPAEFGLKGPAYDCIDGQWKYVADEDSTFRVNNWQASWFPGDDSLVTVRSSGEAGVFVDALDDWKTDEGDGHTYASWTMRPVSPGKGEIEVLYDGVKVGGWGCTVVMPDLGYNGFVAYDDAGFYPDGFDSGHCVSFMNSFGPWKATINADGETTFAGVSIVSNAPDASVLTEGHAFALYANGGAGAEIQLRRQFWLDDGQAFSVVVSPNYRDGTKGVKFMGKWEGNFYTRAEFFYNNDGYFYKLEGDAEATNLGWDYSTTAITITLKKAGDGASYALTFQRGDEVVAKEGITSFQGDVDYVQFYSYEGGFGDENNLVFNILATKQVEEAADALGWEAGVPNPDVPGEYTYTLWLTTYFTLVGEVALSVEPSDGALRLSTDKVDMFGTMEQSFTAILSEANEGDHFVITATPVGTTLAPIPYYVTVVRPHVTLSCENWEFPVSARHIRIVLTASPSKYGTYKISSSDESVLAVSEGFRTVTVDSTEEQWVYVQIVGTGQATIYATPEGAEEPAADFTFTITGDAPVIGPETIQNVSFANGFFARATTEFETKYSEVKAQRLEWNGSRDSGYEPNGEVLENQAEWPEMKFDLDDPNATLRFIFVK